MDRLLVVEGDGRRAPRDDDLAGLMSKKPAEDDPGCSVLFSIPVHMRTRFWTMLNEEAAAGTGDFVKFSDDVARFLTFKALPPPKDSVCELLVQDAAWPQLHLRLIPGEGCRMALGSPPNVAPPPKGELNVLLAIRLSPA